MSTTKSNSPAKIETYLIFNGRCEEAIEFYRKTLGAEVTMMMRFKDNPEACPNSGAPGIENKIMHASFKIGATTIMASDGRCEENVKFQGVQLSIGASNEAEADRFFAALVEGGEVLMPLGKTFFSPRFGMLTDKFGLSWMVLVA